MNFLFKSCSHTLWTTTVYQGLPKWMGVLLVVFAGLGYAILDGANTKESLPNILFIVADDLRPELGCYGSEIAVTPNIDKLAAGGVAFARAYNQQAVCNPSRSSFMTGLRPDNLRVWDLTARFREINSGIVTLPQYFKSHGYFTQSIGKIFHNETKRRPDRIPMVDPLSWSVPAIFGTGAHYEDWVVAGDPFKPEKKQEAWQRQDVQDEAYFDGQIAANACATLRRLASNDQPFFLAVGFWKPHLPFNAPAKYWDMYDPESFSRISLTDFPLGAPEIARHNWKELRGYAGMPKQGPLSMAQVRELWHGYFACISFLDTQVGKILDELENTGLKENTIIVFFSDHGFHLGEHDLWAKTSNYELDARVPLIIADPRGMVKGGIADGIVELIDLYPTLVELAGLPVPTVLDGHSLCGQLADPSTDGKSYAVTQHPHPFYTSDWKAMGYAIRSSQYRYVEWRELKSGDIMARELYDHSIDPEETKNLINDPAYYKVAESMLKTASQAIHFNAQNITRE